MRRRRAPAARRRLAQGGRHRPVRRRRGARRRAVAAGGALAACARALHARRSRAGHGAHAGAGARSSPPTTCRARTRSASSPTSRTSRCWRRATCAIAARRCWRSSARAQAVESVSDADLPITWTPEPPVSAIDAALAPAHAAIHASAPDNVLTRGNLQCGDVGEPGTRAPPPRPRARFETAFVEHAYIEPEAGYAVPSASATASRSRLHAGALHGSRRDRARARPRRSKRAHLPDRLRRRLRRQARRVGAAAAGGRRLGDRGARCACVYTRTEFDGLHHQAPSRRASGPSLGCDAAGPPHRLRDAGRLQHRRLCLVGADGGQPRAGARRRPLQGAATSGTARAPSTPTTRPPAPSAASACRRRPSPTRR